jgi:hypothetical protein
MVFKSENDGTIYNNGDKPSEVTLRHKIGYLNSSANNLLHTKLFQFEYDGYVL